MLTIAELALVLDLAWSGALPGHEAATRNEAIRALIEALRQPHRQRPRRWHRPA